MAKSDLRHGLKFRRLLRRLPGVSAPLLIGHLELMWQTAWASGVVAFGSGDDAELAAEWEGEPGRLVAALIEEGWIEPSDLGLEIHDWWDHAPDYVRKRKEMLLIAIERGYAIVPQWLRDRGLSVPPPAKPQPTVDQRLTTGIPTVDQWTPIPNPTQPNPTKTKDTSAAPCGAPGVSPPADSTLDLELTPEATSGKARKAREKPAANPDIKRLIDHYHAEFIRLRGAPPVIRGPAAAEAAKLLLAGRGFDAAANLVSEFLRRPPQWNESEGTLRLEDLPAAATKILARASPKGGNGGRARSPDGTPVSTPGESVSDGIETDPGGVTRRVRIWRDPQTGAEQSRRWLEAVEVDDG